MNFVAHLFLSPMNDAFRVGAILADFTVGTIESLETTFGAPIGKGIRHHREIDRFTDTHPAVIHSVDALRHSFGLYGGIVVDVMFDHFLLMRWDHYTRISKETFFASVYQSLSLSHPAFPPRYRAVVDRMLERRWLRTYEDLENVAFALMRIGERFPRRTPLHDALGGIKENYQVMERDFIRFFPELMRFSDEQVVRLTPPTPPPVNVE